MEQKHRQGRLSTLLGMLRSPQYIAITIAAAAAYYFFFVIVIEASSKGAFLLLTPVYIVYALIASAALVFSTSMYALSSALRSRRSSLGKGAAGVITPSAGALVVSCNCTVPIVPTVLYSLGVGAVAIGEVTSFLSAYSTEILVALIALNIILIFTNLGKARSNVRRR